MQTKLVERYFFFGLLFIVIGLSLFIFKPFLAVIAVGASLAVVFHPVYEWFGKRVARGTSWLASLLTVVLFILIVGGPLLGIGAIVFHQTQDAYTSFSSSTDTDVFIDRINAYVNNVLPQGFNFDAREKLNDLFSVVSGSVTTVFKATLTTIFSFVLVLLTLFYFLKDGEEWRKSLIVLSPLADKDDQKILSKLANSINGVIKGYLFIAFAQGILMGVGLAIFGVPNPALWGLLAGVASLVPTIGTSLIAVPAILYLFAMDMTGNAIGLAIWSVTLVGTIDNFLSPIIIGKSTSIPPLLILFSVLGGVSLLGPIGVLLGPLVISLLYALISIYRTGFDIA